MSTAHWTFTSGREFCFGRGAVEHLARITQQEQWNRLLIVTDENLVNVGLCEQVEEVLKGASIETDVYSGSVVEPSSSHACDALEQAKDFRPDAWIGLGGGSNMDLAKMCQAAYTCDVEPEQLFGWDAVPKHNSRLLCVPTTAGTGSEVSHAAILKSAATGKKTPILSQEVRPAYAVVDPNLLDSCPAKVSAESGMDALTHAIEAYLTTDHTAFDGSQTALPYEGNHPLGDMYAERAIELIGKYLVAAVTEAGDRGREARQQMAFAASLAGVAFSSCGVTLAHALEYFVGARYPCSHGIGNAILLPAVMRHQLVVRRERLARISMLLGGDGEAEAAILDVEQLRESVSLPGRLSVVGATQDDLDEIAASAIGLQRLVDLTPCPTSVEDLQHILATSL